MTEAGPADELSLEDGEGGDARTYSFSTRDGLLSTDEFRTEVLALLDAVTVRPDDDVLVVDANYGVAGVVLAGRTPEGRTVLTETSARAVDTCRSNTSRNGVENVTVALTPDVGALERPFDVAVFAPKPYDPVDVVNERLSQAVSRLSTGGRIYVGGRTNQGITRYREALSELGTNPERVAADDTYQVYRGTKQASFEPRTYVSEHEFRATVGDYTCRFLTVPGLFSWQDLDQGTEALLRAVSVPGGQRVLDCCCGYGAVGAFVGARTDCELWATDDDVVATSYAETNLERNGVTPEAVVTGDCTDSVASETFDVVLSNPPTHAGRGVTEKLFSGVRDVLADDGEFYLVANEIMQYDDLLQRDFAFEASVVAEDGKFDVVRAIPR